jgi:hypothetical protein
MNTLANYINTVIYKIYSKDETIKDIYIGHTTNFCQRERLHRSNCDCETSKGYNYKIYKIIRSNGGWNNWVMEIIEKYPCQTIDEAKERERFWIENSSSTLNVTIPNRSKKEYSQLYRLTHKDYIIEKTKQYRVNNKDKINDYLDANREKICVQKHDWYEDNKDYILEKAKNNYEENKEQKIKYQTQYAQENKEKISEYQKEYRKLNEETLAEKRKIYREEHKEEARIAHKEWREKNKEKLKEKAKEKQGETVNCECGGQYNFVNKDRHFKTKVHLQFTEKISDYQKELIEQQKKEQKEKTIEATRVKQGEIVNCECGRQYTFGNRSRHFQTKVHLQYKEQNLESI